MGEQAEDPARANADLTATNQLQAAQNRPLASAEVIRGRVVEILRKDELNLKDHSFFVHGSSSKVVGPSSQLEMGGGDFFTVVNMDTLLIFGVRNLEKAGGGELAGVLLILDNQTIKKLQTLGLLVSKPVDDIPRHMEHIFKAGAAPVVNNVGRWVYLPPDFFKE
jgi:hypothetical protein